MNRAFVLLVALLIGGCAQMQNPDRPPGPHNIDTSCMQDCLGTQADRQLCEDRCSF